MSILNVIIQSLAYDDANGVSDNPNQRAWDWTRRYSGLSIDNPSSDKKVVAPGESLSIFSGLRTISLSGSSVLALSVASATSSMYRLSVTSGPSGFRTARAPTSIGTVVVTVNNNAMAVFSFTAATLTGVVAGDIMRINGILQYDTAPYKFNALNAGLWVVLSVTGVAVSVARLAGQPFSGVAETATTASADVQFYTASGVQVGDSVDITGTLSSVSQRSYTVSAVTPSTVDFVSALPLPTESGLTYSASTVNFYTSMKRFVYIEADQEAVIQLNGDTGLTNRLSPEVAGDPTLPGFFHKLGGTYSCTIVNRSINSMNVKYCLGE